MAVVRIQGGGFIYVGRPRISIPPAGGQEPGRRLPEEDVGQGRPAPQEEESPRRPGAEKK